MDKKQYTLTVVLAVFAGLVGGVVSSWLFIGTLVFAQKPEVAEVIVAKRFLVVDEDGKPRAALGPVDGEPGLWLADKNGTYRAALNLLGGDSYLRFTDKDGQLRAVLGEVTEAGETRQRPVSSLVLFDKEANVIWSAP